MKEFWQILKRYASPYKGYLGGSILLNILSGVFNVFSFSLLIPILQILFNVGGVSYEFIPWHKGMPFNEITNNIYWYITQYVDIWGPAHVLLMLCLVFCAIVAVKTSCYFGAAAVMVPIRTGVVKDLRTQIYNKIILLPLGFFSQERKGDIIARISGDVQEVENSITSTIEMLIKNPILIVIYMSVLFRMSWKLTLFTIIFAPIMIGIMSMIGRRLRATSIEAQKYWSDTMSQVEETLGGLRIIKAFLAEKKMTRRFDGVTEKMRNKYNQVATRQAMAHPVSEFLGSVMIAIVLWFGGTLILGDNAIIDAPSFMAYMAILYSVIQPIKDLSKAAYSIPKGLASMERIDVILDAEDNIREPENPRPLKNFGSSIRFSDVSFRYEDGREVLHHIDLEIPKGMNIAIVGASGAGKSTLVDLIPRFYDPCEGSISIDGTDIREVSTRDLRSLMGNVNQDPILFNDTIFSLRYRERDRRAGGGGRQDSQRPRLHHGEGGRLPDQHRRQGREALGWPEAAHQHSPRDTEEPSDPDSRRSHRIARHRIRKTRAGSPRQAHAKPHHHLYRPQAQHRAQRRRNHSHGQRAHSREGKARGAHSPQRILQAAV